jgi:anaerobic selenocysteine-containing dehydrogenase
VVCTVEDGIFKKVEPDRDHPNGCICVKGVAAPEIVYAPDRLRYPMRRTRPKSESDPGWERISWDEALRLAAAWLLSLKEQYGAEATVFGRPAPGGSPANDYVGWLQRLANAFGSPNLMTTGHICNWHKDTGSKYTYGVGIPAPDFANARCILLWGHNPEASWPVYAMRVTEAQRRGAKLIVIDPRPTEMAKKADLWLRVCPGTDGALALSMIHVLLEEGLWDREFVRDWTNGPLLIHPDSLKPLALTDVQEAPEGKFAAWDRALGLVGFDPERGAYLPEEASPALSGEYEVKLKSRERTRCKPAFQLLAELASGYAPERAEAYTWVSADKIRAAARLFSNHRPSCYYTYVGIEEHTNAMQTNRAICALYALTGQFDTKGSNVLFPRPPTRAIGGKELLSAEQARKRLGFQKRPLGPAGDPGNVQGYEVYKAILTDKPYPVRAMVMFGGNPLVSQGDPVRGREALQALDFYLHVDMFENPGSRYADLLLPACTCWESEAVKPTFEMGESASAFMQLRQAVIPPLHESRPDIRIIFDLAEALGLAEHFWGGDLEEAFNYQLGPSGVTVAALRAQPGGIALPLPLRYQKYREADSGKGFRTATKKIEIFSLPFGEYGYDPLPVYREPERGRAQAEGFPLILTMSKLLPFCHSQHRNIPMLRKQAPQPFLEIHPETAAALGIEEGEWVALATPRGRVKLRASLVEAIHPQVVCAQHGWWQGCSALELPGYDPFDCEGANVNLLISNDRIDPITGSVPHRSSRCRVSKIGVH